MNLLIYPSLKTTHIHTHTHRFYDVVGGRVCVGGEDVRDVTQTSLRKMIGVVPQVCVCVCVCVYVCL
jgi:ABC-type transport system involved in Fe-S cluster assembly fused permease/ATPase subunit